VLRDGLRQRGDGPDIDGRCRLDDDDGRPLDLLIGRLTDDYSRA